MAIVKRIKRANEARLRRYHELLGRIERTNDTRLSDETVLAILNADRGPWTSYASVEEMFTSLGIKMP